MVVVSMEVESGRPMMDSQPASAAPAPPAATGRLRCWKRCWRWCLWRCCRWRPWNCIGSRFNHHSASARFEAQAQARARAVSLRRGDQAAQPFAPGASVSPAFGGSSFPRAESPGQGTTSASGSFEFFDAQSEAGSTSDLESCSASSHLHSPRRRGDVSTVQRLLESLQTIELRCRDPVRAASTRLPLREEGNGKGDGREPKVHCLLNKDAAQFWLCEMPGSSVLTVCLCTKLEGIAVDDAVRAITCGNHRLAWDGEIFRSFDVVTKLNPEDPDAGEVIYCVVKAPSPLKDRDMLQHRWLRPLPGGGQAIVMRSLENEELRPRRSDCVRAFTHYSCYFLRPLEAGNLEVVAISHCDLGGIIPSWAQNLVHRLSRSRPIQWGQRLTSHCRKLKAEREAAAAPTLP
eukprot:gnl/TRDRNA2_/TRDRNA2_82374_c0_seq1.p1 gnl/TRDRNA2_/TRDRNA2_82374_c0~~gnl/TRDRNA2_/TRDRNA2_82374_c0_seq1.p1  ORF type:complete len:404 (-),score=43.86 gnl/TRDRNA2_/TRDRNA2_82374_c0_seq1:34-1245(-)